MFPFQYRSAMITLTDVRSHMTNPAGRFRLEAASLSGIAMHHSVSGDALTEAATPAAELAHLKAIDAYHVAQGFGGIGYHLAVFPSGRRYLLGDLNGARAHVASRNHELLGIVAIGTFTEHTPRQLQLDGLQQAVLQAREHAQRPLPVRGHNAWAIAGQGTLCPGALSSLNWDQAPAGSNRMIRFNGIARSLERLDAAAGIRNGVLNAVSEFSLPPDARSIRLEVALQRGAFAVGDGTYAGRIDEHYGSRLGIIDACLLSDGTLLFDAAPGTLIERVGCLGYWT